MPPAGGRAWQTSAESVCVCVTEREGGREARAAPRMPDGGAEPEPEPEKKKLTGWRAKAAKKLEEAKKGAEKFAKEAEERGSKLAKEADEQLSLAVASGKSAYETYQ